MYPYQNCQYQLAPAEILKSLFNNLNQSFQNCGHIGDP